MTLTLLLGVEPPLPAELEAARLALNCTPDSRRGTTQPPRQGRVAQAEGQPHLPFTAYGNRCISQPPPERPGDDDSHQYTIGVPRPRPRCRLFLCGQPETKFRGGRTTSEARRQHALAYGQAGTSRRGRSRAGPAGPGVVSRRFLELREVLVAPDAEARSGQPPQTGLLDVIARRATPAWNTGHDDSRDRKR